MKVAELCVHHSKTVLAVFLLIVAGMAMSIQFIVYASWSTLGTGYAITSNYHGIDVPIATPVTLTAGTLDHSIVQVTFRWHFPNGTAAWADTAVPVVSNGTTGTWNNGTATEILYAQDTQTPNVVGDWEVQAFFQDAMGKTQADVDEVIAVKAGGTIYIRADGSIDPPTAPIFTADNITYVLTGNISSSTDGIVIERTSAIIDGNGFGLQGSGGIGIRDVIGVHSSTIRNLSIQNFAKAIEMNGDVTVAENDIVGDLWFWYCTANISNNNITGDIIGLTASMTISGNSVNGGISVDSDIGEPCSASIVQNEITGAVWCGGWSCGALSENTIHGDLHLVTEGGYSILRNSVAGVISIGFGSHTIGENNLGGGIYVKPFEWPRGLSVSGNDIRGGISLNGECYAQIFENNICESSVGLTITHGMFLGTYTIHHNNFVNNSRHVGLVTAPNVAWDDGLEGNFWDNYTGYDLNKDGIGDTPHFIDSSNTDYYPLMLPFRGNNIAIINVTASSAHVYAGDIVTINVTLSNEGIVPESFNVTASYDNIPIDTQIDIHLNPDAEITIIFDWNTSGAPGNHRISANASVVPGEIDVSNNMFVNGIVEVIYRIEEPIGTDGTTAIEGNVTITQSVVTKNTLHFKASGPSGSTGWINVTFPMINMTDIKVLSKPPLDPSFPIITSNGTHYFIYFEFSLSSHEIVVIYADVDIALISVDLWKAIVGENNPCKFSVTLSNQGDNEEVFNVTLLGNGELIGILGDVMLPSGTTSTVTFDWNATGILKGNYSISANVTTILLGELNITNNNLTDGWLFVTLPGDVDADRDVDIFDIVAIAICYGATTGEPTYNVNYDIDGDGDIDIFDIVAAASHYGESW